MSLSDLVKKEDLHKADVYKHTGAIHIAGNLSETQRKASNILLYNAFNDLMTKDEHRVRIKDLAFLLGTTSKNYAHLKDALRGLATTPIEWNVLDQGKEKEWGISTLLAHATMKGGYCYYSYSIELRRKFSDPETYATINLEVQRKISGEYAVILYENCVRYIGVKTTGWIPLDKLRQLLTVDSNEYYNDFRKLNDKILKPALKHLNETSDILIEAEFRRERRKVVAVKFNVEQNPQYRLLMDHEGLSPEQVPLLETNSELMDLLYSYGLTERQVKLAMDGHSEASIREKLALADAEISAGKVKNIASWVYAAIRDDYKKGKSPAEIKELAKKDTLKKRERKKLLTEALEEIDRKYSKEVLERAKSALSESERVRLQGEFVQFIHESRERGMGLVREKFKKLGLENPVVKAHFNLFLKEQIVVDSSDGSKIEFAKEQGYDLEMMRKELSSL